MNDIIAIVIISLLSAIIIAIAIIMLTGHGTSWIAGFNTLSKEEKEKFDSIKLTKFLGKILLLIGVLINGITICIICKIWWLGFVVGILIASVIIISAIYCNKTDRFKKK